MIRAHLSRRSPAHAEHQAPAQKVSSPTVWRWRGAVLIALLAAVCNTTAPVSANAATSAAAGTPVCQDVTIPVTLDVLLPATIHGSLCHPAEAATSSTTVQLLVPGATYNSSYWSGEGISAASYIQVATAAGATTLAIDRIGTGGSTHELSATVTATAEADILHQVITALHQGTVDGQRHVRIVLVGHSLGSMVSLLAAVTYRDVAGLVLTGFAHGVSIPALIDVFLSGLRPADLEGFPADDPGWLTTVSGTRESLFDNPADVSAAVVAADEANRDVVSTFTVPDGFNAVLDPLVSAALTIPVLVVDGGADTIFCGPLTPGCPTSAALYAREAVDFPHASLATYVLPDAGHDVSLARDGNQAATPILARRGVHRPRRARTLVRERVMVMVDDVPVRPAPNFLVIHGGWQDSWWWQPAATHLARLGFRCWTPDLPGCAPSDPDVATVTVRMMADAVIAQIEATPQMRDLVLVVHSGGGPVGQLVAAAVPERIAAMVFVDAWVLTGGSGQECIGDLLPATLAPIVDLARRGEPVPMDPGLWFAEFAQDAGAAARRVGGPRVAATPCPPDWVVAALDWRPFWDLLDDGVFPAYYLFLDQDRVVPTEVYWQMAQRLRPAATAWAPGSHQGFHPHFREFTQTLLTTVSAGHAATGPLPAGTS